MPRSRIPHDWSCRWRYRTASRSDGARSGVEAALATAETEVDKALEALSEAEARIDGRDGGFDEATTGALTAAIAMARQADDVARSRAADRICRERADELADRLIELLPWTGDRNTLCAASVPAQDQLQRWASVEADLSLEIASRQGEEDRLAAEAGRLDAKIDALRSVVGVVSDNDAAEARSAREAAWAIHKAELHVETAVTFEAAMRRLDLITEQRFSHTARVAELNSALLERAEARAALEQTGRELQESLRKRAGIGRRDREGPSRDRTRSRNRHRACRFKSVVTEARPGNRGQRKIGDCRTGMP